MSSAWPSLAITALLVACTAETTSVGEERSCLFGATPGPGSASDELDRLATLETLIERPLVVHRIYRRWNNAVPGDLELETIAQGRIPIVSWNGQRGNEDPIDWVSVARGDHDDHIAAIADGFAALPRQVFAIYHQNPDKDLGTLGTADDYRRAFRRVVDIFRARGATNVTWVWSMRSPAFPTVADALYPGNDVVDWIGANAYNYGTEQSPGRWVSLRALLADFVAWAAPLGKPLMVPEFASTEDPNDPTRKAKWLLEVPKTLRGWPAIRAVSYYHSDGSKLGADSSPEALEAFRAMVSDSHFSRSATDVK